MGVISGLQAIVKWMGPDNLPEPLPAEPPAKQAGPDESLSAPVKQAGPDETLSAPKMEIRQEPTAGGGYQWVLDPDSTWASILDYQRGQATLARNRP